MGSSHSPRNGRKLSRRQFLSAVPAVALPIIVAACGAPAPAPAPTQPPAKPAAPAPTQAPAAAAPTPAPAAKPTQAPAAAAPTQAPAKPVASTYQGKFVVFGYNVPEQGQAKLNQDFQAAHPGVQVEYIFYPSQKFVEMFTAVQNSGDQIDALILNGQDLRRYATGKQLVDLTDTITYKSRFREIGLKTYSIGGRLWALPYGWISGFPIFNNKALLDKAGLKFPATFQEMVDAKPVLQKAGVSPLTHPGKDIYYWPVWFFTAYAQTSKNQSVEKTIATLKGELKFTDPEVVAGLDAIFKFGKEGLFIEGVNALDQDGSWANFLTGKAMGVLHATSNIRVIREANPPNMNLDIALAPRMVDDPKVDVLFPGGTGAALSIFTKVDEKRKPLAFEYLEFLTQEKNVEWLCKQYKNAVATVVNANPSDDPVGLKFASMVDKLRVYLDWMWPPAINRSFQEVLQAGVGGQKTAEAGAKEIQATFDKLVAEGYKWQD